MSDRMPVMTVNDTVTCLQRGYTVNGSKDYVDPFLKYGSAMTVVQQREDMCAVYLRWVLLYAFQVWLRDVDQDGKKEYTVQADGGKTYLRIRCNAHDEPDTIPRMAAVFNDYGIRRRDGVNTRTKQGKPEVTKRLHMLGALQLLGIYRDGKRTKLKKDKTFPYTSQQRECVLEVKHPWLLQQCSILEIFELFPDGKNAFDVVTYIRQHHLRPLQCIESKRLQVIVYTGELPKYLNRPNPSWLVKPAEQAIAEMEQAITANSPSEHEPIFDEVLDTGAGHTVADDDDFYQQVLNIDEDLLPDPADFFKQDTIVDEAHNEQQKDTRQSTVEVAKTSLKVTNADKATMALQCAMETVKQFESFNLSLTQHVAYVEYVMNFFQPQ